MFQDNLYERFDRGDLNAAEVHREFCRRNRIGIPNSLTLSLLVAIFSKYRRSFP